MIEKIIFNYPSQRLTAPINISGWTPEKHAYAQEVAEEMGLKVISHGQYRFQPDYEAPAIQVTIPEGTEGLKSFWDSLRTFQQPSE